MIAIMILAITALLAGYFFLGPSIIVSVRDFLYPSSLVTILLYMLIFSVSLYRIGKAKKSIKSILGFAFFSVLMVAVIEKSFTNLTIKITENDIQKVIEKNREKLKKGSKTALNPEHWNIEVRSKTSLGVLGFFKKINYTYSLGYNISLKEIEKLEAISRDDFTLVRLDHGKCIKHSSQVRKAIEIELAKKIIQKKHE